MRRIEVGRHVFEVPDALVRDDDMFFAPKPDTQTLSAVVNGDAPEGRRRSVFVQTSADACRTAVGEQLRTACAVAEGRAPAPAASSPNTLSRRQRHPDDPTFYDYVRSDGSVAIGCSAASGGTGECTLIHAWRDLVWQIDFPESEADRADEYRAEVVRKLDEWAAERA